MKIIYSVCELWSEDLNEGWSLQLYTQLFQLQKKAWIPYKPEFFSDFLFATAKVVYITAMIILHLILHLAVHIYDF